MSEKPSDNPYATRNHEDGPGLNPTDLPAIAALVGTTTGELKKIDGMNIGDSSFTQALKMNPHEAVKSLVGNGPTSVAGHNVPPPGHNAPPSQVRSTPPVPRAAEPSFDTTSIESRILALEKFMETQKRDLKFKRGITYDISTATIKGNFKSPSDILDIVLTEMAKNTKTITLKLCNANKSSK